MTLWDQFGDTVPVEVKHEEPIDLEAALTAEYVKERETRECDCKLLGPPLRRTECPVGDATDRTCWACFAPVRIKGDKWYIDEDRHVCLCEEHKDYEGRHGGAPNAKYHPRGNALEVARKLQTSTPKSFKKRGKAAPPPPKPVVKSVDEDLETGEVIDEVAEFLKSMGRM